MLGVIAVLLDPSGACPPTVLASVRWSSKASGRPWYWAGACEDWWRWWRLCCI